MNRWYTADLHLGHTNIIKYEHRPFDSVEEMNEGIIYRWNSQVDPLDTVYIIGDLCMGQIADTLKLVQRLNGFKYLESGNHDRCWFWSTSSAKPIEDWTSEYLEAGLSGVKNGEDPVMADVGDPRVLCRVHHFPFDADERHGDKYAAFAPLDDGNRWLIHGHVHSAWRQKARQINVGIDAWGGWLTHESEIAAMIAAGPQDIPAMPWTTQKMDDDGLSW